MSIAIAAWRKSSHSGGIENTNCVEVAPLTGVIGVRDSKDLTHGQLNLPIPAWSALTESLRK